MSDEEDDDDGNEQSDSEDQASSGGRQSTDFTGGDFFLRHFSCVLQFNSCSSVNVAADTCLLQMKRERWRNRRSSNQKTAVIVGRMSSKLLVELCLGPYM